jgi:ParB-like chromosome segregation protein Spo0J
LADATAISSSWLVRAHRWRRRIESGHAKSITDLAEQEGVTVAYVCRLLPLTCLAPDIVEAILDGRQPKGLRLAEMLGNEPLSWNEQRRFFGGFCAPNDEATEADAGPQQRVIA